MTRFPKSIAIRNALLLLFTITAAGFPAPANQQHPFNSGSRNGPAPGNHNVSDGLFAELEELARLVDIAYCVGVTGIQAPFECASRCDEFPGYQLVDTWNTGPLMSDSCGYIALDHRGGRIIVAFRGTYSITNTIMDLATVPQEYVPYPGDPDDGPENDTDEQLARHGLLWTPWRWLRRAKHRLTPRSLEHNALARGSPIARPLARHGVEEDEPEGPKCSNCTVHMGFFSSWKDCRRLIIPHLKQLYEYHPSYKLHLVGHSLGGAVAALAALETEVLGWHPTITTFGEPRIGNTGLRDYLNAMFKLDNGNDEDGNGGRYRRMTHTNDPVPLLPLTEWGYQMHSGEIYISKPELQPSIPDLRLCDGDEDEECIFGGEVETSFLGSLALGPRPESALGLKSEDGVEAKTTKEQEMHMERLPGLPARYRIWQLFFAHRDYFWRLGLCVKGGDPIDWGRKIGNITAGEGIGEPKPSLPTL